MAIAVRVELCDPVRRFTVILSDDFRSANEREECPIAVQLRQLRVLYPTLRGDAVAGDACFGFDLILHLVYAELHARRVVDLRAHETDRDKLIWPTRGYDDKGRPVCPFGYTFTANGWDAPRQRYKWLCGQACRHEAVPKIQMPEVVYPPPECAYLGTDHPHGAMRNIAECCADGSTRLVRDLPAGRRARGTSERSLARFCHVSQGRFRTRAKHQPDGEHGSNSIMRSSASMSPFSAYPLHPFPVVGLIIISLA